MIGARLWLGALAVVLAVVLPAAAQTMTDAQKSAFADTLGQQIADHWPPLSADAAVVVTVAIEFAPDGRIARAQLVEVGGTEDEAIRAEAVAGIQVALRHFAQTPFIDLPLDQHEEWRAITLRFHSTPETQG